MPRRAPDGSGSEDAVDRYIGRRICHRRRYLRLSQFRLGQMVGIAQQQLAKYETSEDRVSMSRLVTIAAALSTPVTFFLPRGITNVARPPLRKQLLPAVGRLRQQLDRLEKKLKQED